jgi:hypothetical protein
VDPRYKAPGANVDIETERDFRDLGGFTAVLRWMLIAGALVTVVVLASTWMQLRMLSAPFTEAEAQANTTRELAASGLATLLLVTIIVVFGRWIVLAHRNLRGLGIRYAEITPGWAVGWFFIPILNLWKPFEAMRFLWKASHDARQHELQRGSWVLTTWWSLWLLSSLLGAILTMATLGAKTVESLTEATRWILVTRVVDFFQYVIAVILVSRIWEAQRRQHETPGEFDPSPGFADA